MSEEITVFLAAPKDTDKDTVIAAIEDLNNQHIVAQKFVIKLVRWDDKRDPVPLRWLQCPQETIEKHKGQIQDFSIVIGLLKHRLGTPLEDNKYPDSSVTGKKVSGTEWELRQAEINQKPIFLFQDNSDLAIPPNLDEAEAIQAVHQYSSVKKFISNRTGIVHKHRNANQLKEKVTEQLRAFIGNRSKDSNSIKHEKQYTIEYLLKRYIDAETEAFTPLKTPSYLDGLVDEKLTLDDISIKLPVGEKGYRKSNFRAENTKSNISTTPDNSNQTLRSGSSKTVADNHSGSENNADAIGSDNNDEEKYPFQQLLVKNKQLIVFGDSGSGKSTLLKQTAVALFKELSINYKSLAANNCTIPIVIDCQTINEVSSRDIKRIIIHILCKRGFSKKDAGSLSETLFNNTNNLGLLLLLDDFEKINDINIQDTLLSNINEWTSRSTNNRAIITSRSINLGLIESKNTLQFTFCDIKSLGKNHRYSFCDKLKHCIADKHKVDRELLFKNLSSIICDDASISDIFDNISILIMAARLISSKFINKTLPPSNNTSQSSVRDKFSSKSTILDSLINDQIEGQISGISPDVIRNNDVIPPLRTLAFAMKEAKITYILETELIKIIEKSLLQVNIQDYDATQWLDNLTRRIEILQITGEEQDTNGITQKIVAFRQPIFQEYFATYKLTADLDALRKIVGNMHTEEVPISQSSAKTTEPVIEQHWNQTLHSALENFTSTSGTRQIEEVIAVIIPDAETSEKNYRVRAILAMHLVAKNPAISNKLKLKVFVVFSNSMLEFDCRRTTPTSLFDKAAFAISNSTSSVLFIDYLSSLLVAYEINNRNLIFGLLLNSLGNCTDINDDLDYQLQKLKTGNDIESIQSALVILDVCFFNKFSEKSIFKTISNTIQSENEWTRVINALIIALNRSQSIAECAAWALAWATDSLYLDHSRHQIPFPDKLFSPLIEYINNNKTVNKAHGYLALILSKHSEHVPVPKQADWFSLWAKVADGLFPQHKITQPTQTSDKNLPSLLKNALYASQNKYASSHIEISLFRLGHFDSTNIRSQGKSLTRDWSGTENREDAALHLTFSGESLAISELYKAATRPVEDRTGSESGFLGLIGTGDYSALREALFNDPNTDRSLAYAYTLAGIADKRGSVLLQSLAKSKNSRFSKIAGKALKRAKIWTEEKSDADTQSLKKIRISDKNNSHMQKLEARRALVYYIRSTPDDKMASWFFLKLDPKLRYDFDDAMNGTAVFDLKDYGEILESGYGEDAADKLKASMSKIYGVEYDDDNVSKDNKLEKSSDSIPNDNQPAADASQNNPSIHVVGPGPLVVGRVSEHFYKQTVTLILDEHIEHTIQADKSGYWIIDISEAQDQHFTQGYASVSSADKTLSASTEFEFVNKN